MSSYYLVLSNCIGILPATIAHHRGDHYMSALFLITTVISGFYHAVHSGLVVGYWPFTSQSLLTLDHSLSHSAVAATIFMMGSFSHQVSVILNLVTLVVLIAMTHDAVLSSMTSGLFILAAIVIKVWGDSAGTRYDWGHGSWHVFIFIGSALLMLSIPPNQLSIWRVVARRVCPGRAEGSSC